ncbi:MAG: hypothetical protein ABSC61_06810 [Anaerolineales bacterium]
MTAPRQDPIRFAGIPFGDVVDVLRSEPALAWFVAQGLWLSQPVLEIFWPQEQIAQVAEMLETAGPPAPERQPDGCDRAEHKGP